MLENKTEQQARQQILELVEEYCNNFKKEKPYEDGKRIPYAGRVFDSEEMTNLVSASLDFWLTSGKWCEEFEKNFGEFLGVPFVSLVNSGSSANLLAFMALTSPLLKERQILPGDEVITVAAGFPTTISPIVQYGAVPVFADITIPEYNIDVNSMKKALSAKTKAVMLAHTLGNPFNIKEVKDFCDKNNLWLIEDNCDALGSQYTLDGNTGFTGTFGDIGTSSFYPPHHMTMGEGGAVYTSDALLNKIVRSLRDWGRDCVCPSGCDNLCGHRFDRQYGELPLGYDHKYVYSHFGYNLKATEMQGAIGCAQLKKLADFTKARQKNFEYLKSKLLCVKDSFVLPQATADSIPSWFGFMMTCKNGVSKNQVVTYCEEHGVQTRMLFAGNMTRQPAFDHMRNSQKGFRIATNLNTTDVVMENSFWVGVYPGMTQKKLDYMAKTIIESINK